MTRNIYEGVKNRPRSCIHSRTDILSPERRCVVFKRVLMLTVAAMLFVSAVGCGRHKCCMRDPVVSFAPPPPPPMPCPCP